MVLLDSSNSSDGAMVVIAMTTIAIAFYSYHRGMKAVKQNKELVSDLAEANKKIQQYHLEHLKFQLSPHTLINAIGDLTNYASKTVEGLKGLNQIMDFILHEGNQQSITLKKELKFLRAFIELNKIKVSSVLIIDPVCEIPEADELFSKPLIPPFLTAYFVENAFKHGDKTQEGEFSITLKRETGKLVYVVKNKIGPPNEAKREPIGQKNLEERMRILFPGKHRINYRNENGYYTAHLELHLPS